MRLTDTDASFVYAESASGPMHISSVYVLEGVLPFEDVLNRFEARLHLVPAYRRKLAQVPFGLAHPRWVDDPDFDLRNHVVKHVLPAGATLEDGMSAAMALNEPMLDRRRPLWKVVVIEGVPGKTLILQMTHHAMIDGASGIELTTILYDLDPKAGEPKPPATRWHAEPPPGAAALVNEAIYEQLGRLRGLRPQRMMSAALSALDWRLIGKALDIASRFVRRPAITAPFNAGLVGPKRRIAWTKKSFADIREIRRHLGGTINDVVLAVVTEAVARYLVLHRERVEGEYLRVMCPVNVRTEDQKGALGNQVSAIFPMLPAWPMRPEERLAKVIEEMERIKTGEEAQALTLLRERLPALPPVGLAFTQVIGTPLDPTRLAARFPLPVLTHTRIRPPNYGINFVCTNVPGVQVPQYMCGHEVTDTIGLLVLTGNVGFSVTILSYNKQLFFNFICEPRLLPDLERIVEGADAVFGELLAAAAARSAPQATTQPTE
jgi:WS/DGAT/MGAT family acyltransferase